MMRLLLAGGLLLALAACLLHARPGIVKTSDGRMLQGDVTEQDENVIINVRGVEVTLPSGKVESIQYAPDVQQILRQRLDQLDPNDAAGRIRVARAAIDEGQYILAREALDSALQIDPNNGEAARLMETTRMLMRLERKAATAPARAQAPVGEPRESYPATTTTRPATAPDHQLLSTEQINRIRQEELRGTDTPVRIRFADEVRQRYAEHRNISMAELNSLRPLEQAMRIIRLGDEDMRRDVRVMSDPSSILEYRRFIQPMVMANCATSGCHGAAGSGGFMLIAPADGDPATYTNFYILQKYSQPGVDTGGIFSGGERRMIDRDTPERSLLVQYGLPPNLAELDHPDVQGHRNMFRTREDGTYRRLIEWMGSSLRPIAPDYGIDFPLPGRTPQTRPATRPVTQQASQPVP